MRLSLNVKLSAFLIFIGIISLQTLPVQAAKSNLVSEYDNQPLPQDYEPSAKRRGYYIVNQPITPDELLLEKTCSQLDDEITYLIPNTYSYKPGFYDDSYNGAAIWGMTLTPMTAVYLPASWVMSFEEEGKIANNFYRIEKLRKAKQMKECFVN